ncbi:MAG: uracil-DNA glycosylase [Pseudomonadota bacterium]
MTLRQQYLDAMGIQQWIPRYATQTETEITEEVSPVEYPVADVIDTTQMILPEPSEHAEPMPDVSPEPFMETPPDNSIIATASPERIQRIAVLDWDALQSEVKDCTECELHQGRTQTVFGVGDPAAKLMIVGEGPGAEEDRQGEPFVGRAGKLLDAMLHAVGFEREQVYIGNVVKCRPPNNRNPEAVEMATCGAYLSRQIEIIQPSLMLAVGKIPATYLLQQDASIGSLRGKKHMYQPTNTPVVVTYHPAYLLRRPEEKSKSWQDLQFTMKLLETF